ncbi:MAG: hypothetical protein ABI592_01845 [Acidobacteriota bacterium]
MIERRRLARIATALAFSAIAFSARPAFAQRNCTVQFVLCLDRAAQQQTGIGRSAAGLDCAFAYAGCVRKEILGV